MEVFRKLLRRIGFVRSDVDERDRSEATLNLDVVEGTDVPESPFSDPWYGDGILEQMPYPTDGVTPLVHGYAPPVFTRNARDRHSEWSLFAHWFEDDDLFEVLLDKVFVSEWIDTADTLDVDNMISSLLILRQRS